MSKETSQDQSCGSRTGHQRLRRLIFLCSLLAATLSLAARLWPIDRFQLIEVSGPGNKRGYINTSGRIVIRPEWDSISEFDRYGTAHVRKAGLDGKIDRHGNIVVQPDWHLVAGFDAHGMAFVVRDRKAGWINSDGRVIIPPELERCANKFDLHGLVQVEAQGKFGWIDRSGEMVIPAEWDESRPFDRYGMAAVRKGDRWGWIDTGGVVVIAPRWDDVPEEQRKRTGAQPILEPGKLLPQLTHRTHPLPLPRLPLRYRLPCGMRVSMRKNTLPCSLMEVVLSG